VHGRRGEAHLAGELGVAGAAVGTQEVDQLLVHGVDGALSVLLVVSRSAPSIAADVR
jgi:hypothetical protein